MKKSFKIAVVLFFLSFNNHLSAQTNTEAAQTANKSATTSQKLTKSKTEQELNKVTKEVINAFLYADKKVLEHYLANGYLQTLQNGQVITKAQVLGGLEASPAGTTWDVEDLQVKDYGNTVVESSKRIYSFETADKRITQLARITVMFLKQEGQWKIIASHVSDIPAEKTAAKVNPAIYDAYVGQYQIANNALLTLTREGDKLMGKATGNKISFEFLPENETTFFIKGQQDQIAFVKDDKGQVTHILHRYTDGQEVKEMKVK